MSFTINAQMVKNLSVDLDTVEAIESAGIKTGGRLRQRNNDSVLDNVLLGIVAETHIAMTGDTATSVAERYGVAGGTVSKSRKFARVARYANTVRGDDSPYDADTEARLARLQAFYDAEYNGRSIGSLASQLRDFVAPSGEDRPSAIVTLVNTFGASNRMDDIMEGRTVHPSVEPEQNDDDDESGDDESGDDDNEIAWTVKLAEAIDRARRQGATSDEISAEFMRLIAG